MLSEIQITTDCHIHCSIKWSRLFLKQKISTCTATLEDCLAVHYKAKHSLNIEPRNYGLCTYFK